MFSVVQQVQRKDYMQAKYFATGLAHLAEIAVFKATATVTIDFMLRGVTGTPSA